MLAPQFTIRRMMLLTTGAALLALVAEAARRGQLMARTGVIVLLLLASFFLISGTLFLFAATWARLRGRTGARQGESPFAEHRPPPQLIHPEEPI